MFTIASPIAKLPKPKNQNKLSATILIKSVMSIFRKKGLNIDEWYNKIFQNKKHQLQNLGPTVINIPILTSSMKNSSCLNT